ncbi:pimeloyl-ACP methyl ester carboxylesterase [Ureibacillus xyleni]|uniref:Pimeloyl-ACP methyl ester carboxylesterase n=2 Tax=Ureibacillus xyleni TaxID=614648 RepID=A0A285SKF1_9BACL|nr:pimeloyl-ACP methyl ester carboxylesterase [Ureibacillus xyleni]
MWNGIFPLFQEHYQLIAPDFRGHGKSSRPMKGYHIEDMANDIFLLLQQLEIPNCHVIGSSLGAEVGVCLASKYPDFVLSLTCEGALYNEFGEYGIFNGSIEEIEDEKSKIKLILEKRKLNTYSSLEEFISSERAIFDKHGIWNSHVHQFLSSCAERLIDGSYVSHYKNEVRIEYIQKYWEVKFEEYYKKVVCPVLFMVSEEESNNEKIRNSLTYFRSLIPLSEINQTKGSIHAYVWMQKPDDAGNVAFKFIQKYYSI